MLSNIFYIVLFFVIVFTYYDLESLNVIDNYLP